MVLKQKVDEQVKMGIPLLKIFVAAICILPYGKYPNSIHEYYKFSKLNALEFTKINCREV